MFIYHVVLPEDWSLFDTWLYRPKSLESDGFIHCSFADQLEKVIKRYYQGVRQLVILKIDSDKLMSRVLKESSTNDEIYPHIYGPVNRNAIVDVRVKNMKSEDETIGIGKP